MKTVIQGLRVFTLRNVVPGLLWTNDTITVSTSAGYWAYKVKGTLNTLEESFCSRKELTEFCRKRGVRLILSRQ